MSLYVLALDIRQAFPSVQVMLEREVPAAVINAVIALACTERTRVRWGAATTNQVSRGRGLRQGCPFSPWCFTFILDWAIQYAARRARAFRVDMGNVNLLPLAMAYADDLVILPTNLQQIRQFVRPLIGALRVLGLEVNPTKSELMIRGPHEEPPPAGTMVDLGPMRVPQVANITYLGGLLSQGLARTATVQQRTLKGQRSTDC